MKIFKLLLGLLALPILGFAQTVDVIFTPITVDNNTIQVKVDVTCSSPRYLAAIPSGWNYSAPNVLVGSTPGWDFGEALFGASAYNITAVRFGYTMNPAIPAGDRLLINSTPKWVGTLVIDLKPTINFPFSVTLRTSGAASLSASTYPDNTGATGLITHTAGASNITVNGGAPGSAPPMVFSSQLPVELAEFAAAAKGESNHITWATESELNSRYHIVERSADGVDNWAEVGRKQAMGTTQARQRYSLEDARPLAMSYYRLKMLDFDGQFEYSKVVSVERRVDKFGVVSMYPVPTTDRVNLQVNLPEASSLTVSISDENGRLVQVSDYETTKGLNPIEVDMSRFAAGTYYVKIDNGVEQLSEQIMKQ